MTIVLLAGLSAASAEGFVWDSYGVTVHAETVMYVDGYGRTEVLFWYGVGRVSVTAPDKSVTRLGEDGSMPLDQVGPYMVVMEEDQPEHFELEILGASGFVVSGRVHSYEWILSVPAEGYLDQYFFVPTPQHSDLPDDPNAWDGRLSKVLVQGVYGAQLSILANRSGVESFATQSTPNTIAGAEPDLPLYLNFPEALEAAAASEDPGELTVVFSNPSCEIVSEGISSVELTYTTGDYGQVAFVCSLDDTIDLSSSDGDIISAEGSGPGVVGWWWQGDDTFAQDHATPGTYTCTALLLQSPLHALVYNADYADPGIRLFETTEVGTYFSQDMFWNDGRLDDGGALAYSGASGIASGGYFATATRDRNARGWGTGPGESSRGTDSWLDTWTYHTAITGPSAQITVVDPTIDTDSDGLPDAEEDCLYGTDPSDDDSDDDGLTDGEEIEAGTDPLDASDPGVKDTGDTADTADTAADTVLPAQGDLGGGACRCSAGGGVGGPIWLALTVLVWRRRR
ncbi:MAG: hypothetical protein ACI8S6_005232 [Myxococcota bacterium]|jgi:hypothetical protein